MRQVVDEGRAPDPLTVHVDRDNAEEALQRAAAALPEGYRDRVSYQIHFSVPPVDDPDELVEAAERRGGVQVAVCGYSGDGREVEQVVLDYRVADSDAFADTSDRIADAIDDTPYDLDFWDVRRVPPFYHDDSGVLDALEALPCTAEAYIDTGLDDDPSTDTSITVGWSQTAPMDNSLQFGYRAFPTRETDHLLEQVEPGEELVDTLLEALGGGKQDVMNEHAITRDELEVLRTLENSLYRHAVL